MRVSRYANLVPYENGVLVHNCLFNSAIRITNPEYISQLQDMMKAETFNFEDDNPFCVQLKESKIIVDDDADEIALVNFLYENQPRLFNLFLIVTRGCNFRCPYCVQDHENRRMQPEVYEDALKILEKNIAGGAYDQIVINFFGGEPTLEMDSIISFMKKAQMCAAKHELKKPILAHITSNGYLLTPDNFEQLVECGVTHYQITVDGMKETHDKTRILANGKGSWETIINNLRSARDTALDFSIQIRTNYTKDVMSNMDAYLQFVLGEFGDDDRFKLYFESAKDYGTIDLTGVLDIYQEEVESSKLLLEKFKANGVKPKHYSSILNVMPFSLACYASNPHQMVIDYDGAIRKCTFDMDTYNNYVGMVKNGEVVFEPFQLGKWSSYRHKDQCTECSIYPVCYGKKCPASYHNKPESDETPLCDCGDKCKEGCEKKRSFYCRATYNLYETALVAKYLL